MSEDNNVVNFKDETAHNKIINDLLQKITTTRGSLEDDLIEISKIKNKVENLFPADITDFRNKHLLEEKLKTFNSFFSTLLNIKQEINKSVTGEIEIRRKLLGKEDNSNKTMDVRALADQLEMYISSEKKLDNALQFSPEIVKDLEDQKKKMKEEKLL